ncbi:ArsR family transcriptional regulator [Halorussus salilacus]|uniref:ArsR family transcriptional regulator n=1 Tax=Halorussus salilacus TaxID=2953750 RepID=UPI0020A14F75|nr:ArsR family transcriptional regulator [Halorussus salilacus]USZ68173.1 ArsR family transcriptional regulator [Halorussus salilacus]
MRPALPEWMTPVDRDILELLENRGNRELVLNPRLIAENTDWKRATIREHVRTLYDHDLLEYYDESGSIYQLSERGRAFLAGELDASDLESDE